MDADLIFHLLHFLFGGVGKVLGKVLLEWGGG